MPQIRRTAATQKQEVAEQLFREYVLARRQREFIISRKQSKYRPAATYSLEHSPKGTINNSFWHRAAEFCLNNNLNPIELVHRIFSHDPASYPAPHALYGKNALRIYNSYNKLKEEDVEAAFEHQKTQYRFALRRIREISPGFTKRQCQRYVLGDSTISLSALFRYCLAIYGEHEDLAGKFLTAAAMQYRTHRDLYDKVWTGWLPKDFNRLAKQIWQTIKNEL
jgi:hypothetical protein